MKNNNVMARLTALAATAGTLAAVVAHATTYTYGTAYGTATELWSNGTGWDASPVGAADTALVFGGAFASGALPVSTNDIAGAFLLNTLTLGGIGPDSATASLTISGNTLRLTGATPTVNLSANRGGGTSPALSYILSTPIELAANTLFTGTGNATFQLDGMLSGASGLTKSGSSTLTLGDANTFTGPTTVGGGTLRLSNANSLSTSAVTVNSGATVYIRTPVTLLDLSGAGTLNYSGNTMVTVNETADGVWSGSAVDNRDGTVTKRGAACLQITGLNAFQVEVSLTVRAGELRICGNGQLGINRTNRGVTVGQGAAFTLDNVAANQSDRIRTRFGGTGKILLLMEGGTILFLGNSAVNSSEVFATAHDSATGGAFQVGPGRNVFDLRAGDGKHAELLFEAAASALSSKNAIVRQAGATLLFQGTQLGLAGRDTLTAESTTLGFTNGDNTWSPTLTANIIKGAIAASLTTGGVASFGLCTYDKGANTASSADDVGVRLLSAGELTLNSLAGGSASNVRLTASTADATGNVNALHLDTGGSITDGGSQTLTVSSGTILSTGAATAIGGTVGTDTLAFGSSEGIFYNAPGSTLTVNAKVTGSGGLTKGGDGTLVLAATTGTGQYTGTTYINGGVLSIDGNSALGQMSTGSPVQLNNGGVLRATATFDLANTGNANRRGITVGGSSANAITSGGIEVANGHTLNVWGGVSGVGKLVKSGAGTLSLGNSSGSYTWSGGTRIDGGRLVLGAAVGSHGDVTVGAGGTLAGTWGASKTLGLAVGKTLAVAANGTLEIDVANAPQTVTGNLDLSASGDVLALTGTVTGEAVLLIYTGTRSGTFDSVTGLPTGFTIGYSTPGEIRLAKHSGTILLIR